MAMGIAFFRQAFDEKNGLLRDTKDALIAWLDWVLRERKESATNH